MNHGNGYRKLGRRTNHRKAMLRNLCISLIEHGRIRTTITRAKSIRPIVEKMVTRAVQSLSPRDGENEQVHRARGVSARRLIARDMPDRDLIMRLFNDIAPKMVGRPGGYTRIVRVGPRKGDNAPMAVIEFVEDID